MEIEDLIFIRDLVLFTVVLITWVIFIFMAHDIGRIKKYLKEIKEGKS